MDLTIIAGVQGAHTARSDGSGSAIVGVHTIVAYDASAGVCAFILQRTAGAGDTTTKWSRTAAAFQLHRSRVADPAGSQQHADTQVHAIERRRHHHWHGRKSR